MKVVVTGATGYVGRPLVAALCDDGHQVVALTRDATRAGPVLGAEPSAGEASFHRRSGPAASAGADRSKENLGSDRFTGSQVKAVTADLERGGDWQAELAGAGAVIHLAGASIAGKRWNALHKQMIHDSRVESARNLVEAIEALAADERPAALVTASGVDYYAPSTPDGWDFDDDDPVDETIPVGDSFLSRVCRDWEDEAVRAEPLGVRVVRMRTGVVLGRGGAVAGMTTPFRLFVGGRIGSGKQWFSWIHLDDAVAAYGAAIADERWRGPINLVAPETVRNAQLARTLGRILRRPSWLPVPAFALRVAVGELAEYLLTGRRVVPAALERLGFEFRHPALEGALRDALDRPA